MGGKVSKLVLVARNNPEVYRKFLSNLGAGCSLGSSLASVGLSAKSGRVILSKVEKGVASREEKKIAKDIKIALGRVMGLTEAELRKQDPKFWLLHGPGRIITNEWNDTQSIMDNNRAAQNSISSKDVTDALIQLYKCGISIDQLIESGQISTLQIGDAGAAINKKDQMATPKIESRGTEASAGMGYGESSWGQKNSGDQKNINPHEPINYSSNPLPNHPSNDISNDKLYNTTPPKLIVSNEPTEVVESIEFPSSPVKGRTKITRSPGKREPLVPPTSEGSQGSPLVSDGIEDASDGYLGASSPMEIGNKREPVVSSQEDHGSSEIGQRPPVDKKKSSAPIVLPHDRNYDGPKIEKVSIMKVDPKVVPEVVPEVPGKKKPSTLPPTNADIARKQHQQKNIEMEEGLTVLETLPDGLRDFLSQKGVV
jgi:hypothetical protein